MPYLEYVLDPANHKPGIKLDWLSYHFYGLLGFGGPYYGTMDSKTWSAALFGQADEFLTYVRRADQARLRLAPTTKTSLEEIGSMLRGAMQDPVPIAVPEAAPNARYRVRG